MSGCGTRCHQEHPLKTMSAIAILTGVLTTSSAYAQTAEPSTAQAGSAAQKDELTEVIVTGVRGAPRSVLDSPTPVDVLAGKELTESGQAGLYQELGYAIPSFDKPFLAGSATSAVIQTGGLRGLDPDQTLVLVNGLRFHRTALLNTGLQLYNGSDPADLGMIPTSGVDHVEVLREGAAAQYGSDAVAGVINIILKDSPGGSLSVQYGQNFDRGDGRLTQIMGDYGIYHSDTGSLNLFFTSISQDQANRAYPVSGVYAAQLPAGYPLEIYTGFGQDPYQQLQFGYNGHQQIGSVELYSYTVWNHRISDIPYPPVYNTSADLPQVYPVLFSPQFQIAELDGQVAVGARGSAYGWDWDLSSTAGQNHARESVSQDINASLGPSSPTSFYVGSLISQEWDNSLDVTRKFDLANAGSLQVSWGLQDRLERFEEDEGDPDSYAVGTYRIPANQLPTYPGQSSFAGQYPTPEAYFTPGLAPSNAGAWTRNIIGTYGELDYTPTQRLFIGLSGRYENYSDTSGSSVVGKLDGRYELTDWMSLRGSIGNGFHAPSLVQEHYSQIKFNLNPTTDLAVPTTLLPVNSPVAIALGATPLRPETSTDMSLGVTLTPASNFNVTVDGYVVNVDHRIALTGLLSGAGVNSILVAHGFTPGLAAQYFTNAINTQTAGVDMVGTYHENLGDWGNLRLTAAASYNNTTITHIIGNPSALSSLSPAPVLFDATSQGYLTSGIPKSKLVIGPDWTLGRIEINLHEIRYGDYSVINDVPANSRTFPAAWITNLDVKLHVTDRVSVTVGANNLFNVYPPATNIPAPQYGFNQYPRTGPFGDTGGSYFGRLQAEF